MLKRLMFLGQALESNDVFHKEVFILRKPDC